MPAPALSPDVETLVREHERVTRENAQLTLRLADLEARAQDTSRLEQELFRLRTELADLRLRGSTRSDAASAPLPPPSSLPRGFDAPSSAERPTGWAVAPDPEPNGGLDFGTVSRLNPSELDQLPYGLICLDGQGRVVHYNDTESRLARLPKESVIGRNFFQDVAPCTRVREFEGDFYALVRDPSRLRVRSFDFVFRFRHSEQHVTIVITPARQRGLYNMALLRRSITPRGEAMRR